MFPLAHFLRQELRDAPGRASYTLRLTLSCAVLITLFMTLQIPFLAVALIVVFYVSQPNVLMIKLVSVVFFVTVTVALGGVLLIIKWTYDYPLIRLAASVALFFCALYLMRVLGKLGLAFFVVALAAWIAAGSERIAYAGIQIGFTFALAFLSWFAPLTNLTELRDRVLGILLGVLVSSIVHLYLWPDSEAPQLKTRLAALYRRLADCLAAPKEAVPLAPLLVAFTDSEALIHRVRAEPLGTYAHPWPQAKGWPMRATLAQAEEIARLSEGYRLNAAPGDPTLTRCAEQLRRYAERIEQEATAPGEQLTADLTNPFGPALAAALAALPDWGPTPIATEQQAKTS